MAKNIKQIQLSDGAHEIDAKYWDGHQWSELAHAIKFIGSAQTTIPTDDDYKIAVIGSTTYYIPFKSKAAATAAEVAAEKGDVFVVSSTSKEYICTKAGSGTSTGKATWTELGDENLYATKAVAGKAGIYTSSDATRSTATVQTSEAGAQTAVGTATVTYKKSDAATGSAGAGESASTGNSGAVSIEYTPAGSITGTQSIGAHSHTVNVATASFTAVTAVATATGEAGAHTHKVTTHKHAAAQTVLTSDSSFTENGDDIFLPGTLPTLTITTKKVPVTDATTTITVVTGVTGGIASGTATVNKEYTHTDPTFSTTSVITGYPNFSGGSITGTRIFNTDAIKSISGTKNYGFTSSQSVLSGATVNDSGVLSWTTATANTQDGHSPVAASTASFTYTAAALGTAGKTNAYTGIATDGGIVSGGTTTVVTGVTGASASETILFTPTNIGSASSWSAGTTPSFTQGTKASFTAATASVSGAISTETLTTTSAGTHTHSIAAATTGSITYVTGATTSAAGATTVDFTKAGFAGTSVTLSQASHTHSYTKPTAHTHTIGFTDADITGTVSVAVSNHKHDMGHTHTVTIPNCNS